MCQAGTGTGTQIRPRPHLSGVHGLVGEQMGKQIIPGRRGAAGAEACARRCGSWGVTMTSHGNRTSLANRSENQMLLPPANRMSLWRMRFAVLSPYFADAYMYDMFRSTHCMGTSMV